MISEGARQQAPLRAAEHQQARSRAVKHHVVAVHHFGAAFGLTRDGEPAHSACLAFGVERWLFAITDRHGMDPESWPRPEEAAQKVQAQR